MIFAFVAVTGVAHAGPVVTLPNALSYEYFGLNYADNIATSSTFGVLNYTGDPGCGGTCTATTALGSNPSVSLAVNEIEYNGGGGGYAEAELMFYVEYVNTPGTYNVTLNASDSFSIPAGIANGHGQSYIAFGPSGCNVGTLHDFCAYTYQDTDCANACAQGVANYTNPSPIPASVPLQMVANSPYALQIWVEINPATSGEPLTDSLDPTFSDNGQGGSFDYSEGVGGSPVPEPATWTMMLMALGGLGGLMRLRKSSQHA
jgi:hypothetical protein